MDELGSYPPPNFDAPPPNTIQLSRPQPSSGSKSNFHPSMWTWSESPTEPEPSWAYGGQGYWNRRPASGVVSHSENYGSSNSYGRGWYQAGQHNWNSSRPAGNRGKKRQNKMEPDFPHFCDTCDRGFKIQEKYHEHVAQHVKCSVPDCSFMAHEKIVSIHWKNTHAPGMKRIKLDTAEEIAKWREERRKNYPTAQNIEKKRKLMQEREKTGAVLETAQFGRMRGRGRGKWRGRGRGHQAFHGQHPQGPWHPPGAGAAAEKPPPLTQSGQNGDPLGMLAKSDIESDRDDADADSRTAGLVVVPKQMSVGLASLVSNYGSISESDTDEGAPDSTIQTGKELLQENKDLLDQNKRPFMNAKTSTYDPQASKVPCLWSALNTSNNRRGQGRKGRRGWGRHGDMLPTRRPTLLEMLLAPDIRHERNILLQCVRYVVQSNFFGLENKTDLQLGINGTRAAGSSDHEVRNGSRTLSDSLVGSKRCSLATGTSSQVATATSNITVYHCSIQNSQQDQGPLHDQTATRLPEDKDVLGSTANQSGTACDHGDRGLHDDKAVIVSQVNLCCSDQADSGLSCLGANCEPPVYQDVKIMSQSDCLGTQKSNNPVDFLASAEQVAEEKEGTTSSDHHSHDSIATYESKFANNIYDDETWEIPN